MKIRAVFEVWKRGQKSARNQLVLQYILDQLDVGDRETTPRSLQMFVSRLCSKISAKWEKSKREQTRFLSEHKIWLDGDLALPREFLATMSCSSGSQPPQMGRRRKPLEECKVRVQKRKVKDLVESKSQDELVLATEISLRASGKRDAANIVRELSLCSPKRATNIKKARKIFNVPEPKLSPEAALALIIDAKLSVYQYNVIRKQAKSVNSNLYPSYNKVQEAKKLCYPPEDAIIITKHSAEVKLQSLLDLTAMRICQLQKDVLDLQQQVASSSAVSLRLISKWGCDGSSAQSRYNQTLPEGYSDEKLFSITFVPIRLVNDETNVVIWQNPRPNSTRFCRLTRFSFQKESKDLIQIESNIIKSQIQNLVPTKIKINDTEVECSHRLVFTMVDGKVCSALSEYGSSQACYICGATPKDMNTEGQVRAPNEEMFAFGISPLHAWIRLFECLLHIAYKLDIRKWRATTKEDKDSVKIRKSAIQKRFRTEEGLLVDMPKQTAGNTNTGNTARAFFRNADKSADITGLNRDVIVHFCAILEGLSCDYELDVGKFDEYAQKTRRLYLQHYCWYPMPATLHKILIHTKDILKTCILPLGQLAEEAQEASNKEYRRNREFFSRKTSREDTNRDILNRFLIASDPLLSSQSTQTSRQRHALPADTIKLLKSADAADASRTMSDSDNE